MSVDHPHGELRDHRDHVSDNILKDFFYTCGPGDLDDIVAALGERELELVGAILETVRTGVSGTLKFLTS